jgi:hypothetical protein
LDHLEPPIWRSIETASETRLDFLAGQIRCAFGWSCTHACKFTVKRRHYGTHNDWVRWDPEQEYEERRRKIQRQKLSPGERGEALNRLYGSWNWDSPHMDEENAIPLLSELVRRAEAKFTFVFDFGDWWTHTVRVEKIEPALPEASYPRCIDGAGADPLEDCGGPGSLMEVFAAVRRPEHPRNDTIQHIITNWVGEGWDFTRFSVEEVNKRFRTGRLS